MNVHYSGILFYLAHEVVHFLSASLPRMTAIRRHPRYRTAVGMLSTAALWCMCWIPILQEETLQTHAKNSLCVRSKKVSFQIREKFSSNSLHSRKKYSMLETRDNKLLDRTDARPSFRDAQLTDLPSLSSQIPPLDWHPNKTTVIH
jgi:hypothetical protein